MRSLTLILALLMAGCAGLRSSGPAPLPRGPGIEHSASAEVLSEGARAFIQEELVTRPDIAGFTGHRLFLMVLTDGDEAMSRRVMAHLAPLAERHREEDFALAEVPRGLMASSGTPSEHRFAQEVFEVDDLGDAMVPQAVLFNAEGEVLARFRWPEVGDGPTAGEVETIVRHHLQER